MARRDTVNPNSTPNPNPRPHPDPYPDPDRDPAPHSDQVQYFRDVAAVLGELDAARFLPRIHH